jgi:tetratricopeptide (TPR) repeat protein
VRQQPDNVAAWLKLGDLIYHYGDREGYPAIRAREPLERALALNAENREAQYHLIDIAGKERDSTRLRLLLENYGPALDETQIFAVRNKILAAGSTAGELVPEVVEAAKSNPQIAAFAAVSSATILEDLDAAQGYASILRDFDPEDPDLAGASLFFQFVRGQIAEATPEMARIAAKSDAPQVTGRALFETMIAMMPLSNFPEDYLPDVRTRLALVDSTVLPRPISDQVEALREYAAGLISYRLEEDDDLSARIRALDGLSYDGDGPDLGYHFAHALRGLQAWRGGDPEAALDHFEEAHFPLYWNYISNPVIDETFNRWVQAEILGELGRPEDALRYLTTLSGPGNMLGLIYLGPSYLRRAEIHEALGNDAEAIDYYTRLVHLWEDADESYQPIVTQAREGIQRILDAQARE